ncbi:MAG: WecB/TagA/CpsF family glycosyltransferase [Chloroflexi bacterium]|nr:WecB/TagA/CpsF family glycosyltransferase [Chloroflexota bacterium]MCL5275417.1 WecB/TagA/CpsF family glycosyltransferase [Chloroflexota bacterium]
MAPLHILGIRVDDVTMSEACDRVTRYIAEGGAHQVATVNPEFIMRARRDVEFAAVLERTDLNVPDGVGVLWAARRLGRPLRERVAGVDLLQQLCAIASQYKWRVFFLGAREGVAERAAANLAFKYQGLVVAGAYAGSSLPKDDRDTLAVIRRARPSLLFVAYGAPAQDKWLARNLLLLQSPDEAGAAKPVPPGLVGIGVGGAFDFITGLQKRAPMQLQRLGLEWLYRLLRQPSRWRRQFALVRFALSVMLQSK